MAKMGICLKSWPAPLILKTLSGFIQGDSSKIYPEACSDLSISNIDPYMFSLHCVYVCVTASYNSAYTYLPLRCRSCFLLSDFNSHHLSN